MEQSTVKIRKTKIEDIDFVIEAERHPENCDYVYQWSRQQHISALTDTNLAHYIIEENNKPAGYIILDDLHNDSNSINLRRLVITKKNRGIGKRALWLIQGIVFTDFKAHRLWLDVFTDNNKAYSLYLKAGFITEGKLRESYIRNRQYVSQYLMSILDSEYKQRLIQKSS